MSDGELYSGMSSLAVLARNSVLEAELSAMKQRTEAAEVRIKASREQRPYGYFVNGPDGKPWHHTFSRGNGELEECDLSNGFTTTKLYTSPVIPPDVAELQRENAELTRKLAEQGMIFDAVLAPRETSIAKLREHFLAEAKSEVVPDELHNVLIAVFREIEFKDDYNDGNAPGHAHDIPGVWDDDNGNLSGTECAWCKLWNTAKAMLTRRPTTRRFK